jgi:hypothetical protein
LEFCLYFLPVSVSSVESWHTNLKFSRAPIILKSVIRTTAGRKKLPCTFEFLVTVLKYYDDNVII